MSAVLSAPCLGALGPGLGRDTRENCEHLLDSIFTCGVDGNKYGGAGCGFGNCVGYVRVQER